MRNVKLVGSFLALGAVACGAELRAQKPVEVVRPVRATLDNQTSLPGQLIAEARLELKARVTGYLVELPVDYGSEVGRGELLARIEVPDLEARRLQVEASRAAAEAGIGDAKAALEVARSKVDAAAGDLVVAETEAQLAEVQVARVRKLAERGGVTAEELDEAEGRLLMARARERQAQSMQRTAAAQVQAAEAGIRSAEAMERSRAAELAGAAQAVAFARLECPFERGVVTRRLLDPGALVRMDEDVILELQRVDKVRAEFQIAERDVAQVAVGTPVDLRLDAFAEPLHGTIARTARALNRNGTMIVQVDLQNAAGKLMPGMFVHATVLTAAAEAAWTLPSRALRVGPDDEYYVLVVDAGKARRVGVAVGPDNGMRVQIDSGLTGDEHVILVGNVRDGEAVRVPEAGK